MKPFATAAVITTNLQTSVSNADSTTNTALWYPNYAKGWNEGVCINDFPAPDGVVTHNSQLACCENSYAGQNSGRCIKDAQRNQTQPSLAIHSSDVWYPDYSR